MRKLISSLFLLAAMTILASCSGGGKSINPDELGNFMIKKLERTIDLTEEQKTQIIQLATEGNVVKEGSRSSEDGAKYQAIRQRIFTEVLTPEQQSLLKPN